MVYILRICNLIFINNTYATTYKVYIYLKSFYGVIHIERILCRISFKREVQVLKKIKSKQTNQF